VKSRRMSFRAEEPEFARTGHPWVYDWAAAPTFDLDAHGTLHAAIQQNLAESIS